MSTKPTKSKTSPKQASFLRNIMFLNEVSALRKKDHQSSLERMISEKKKLHPDLNDNDLKVLTESFNRRYFNVEHDAFLEYGALKVEKEALTNKSKESPLSKQDSDRLALIDFNLSMPVETYAASQSFDPKTIKALQSKYPSISKKIKDEIKKEVSLNFSEENKSVAHLPATVSLFNKKFPKLKGEIDKLSKSSSPDVKLAGLSATSLIATGLKYSNPSGLLLSRAMGMIMSSDSLAPMRRNVAFGIKTVAEKSGLSGWLKKQAAKLPKDSMKRISVGVAAGSAAVLVGVGLIGVEQAADIYNTVELAVTEFVSPASEAVMAGIDNINDQSLDDILENAFNNDVSPSPDTGGLGDEPPVNEELPAPEPSVGDFYEDDADIDDPKVDEAPTYQEPVSQDPSQQEPNPQDSNPQPDGSLNQEPQDPKLEAEPLPSEYTPVPGDTLSEIIEDRLQSAGIPYDYDLITAYAEIVAQENNLPSIHEIDAGVELKMPAMDVQASLSSVQSQIEAVKDAVEPAVDGCSPALTEALEEPSNQYDALMKASLSQSVGQSLTAPVTGEEIRAMRNVI